MLLSVFLYATACAPAQPIPRFVDLESSGQLYPGQKFTVGLGPRRVVPGDVNADGHLDLCTPNGVTSASNISVLLGRSDGTFAEAVNTPTPMGPNDLALAHFDTDGALDMAVSCGAGGVVHILMGQGDGTFVAGAALPVGSYPLGVLANDYDGDGSQDLVVADGLGDEVLVFIGAGDGTFIPGASYPTPVSLYNLESGDLDGDGVLDLAFAGTNGDAVVVLLGFGDGTFSAPTLFDCGNSPRSIAIVDLNEDQIPDLLTANAHSDDASILLGVGDGTFSPSSAIPFGGGMRFVIAEDFDLDGHRDLLAARNSEYGMIGGRVSIRRGLGGGSFGAQEDYRSGSSPNALLVEDFDIDGLPDVAVANDIGGTVAILLGEQGGELSVPLALSTDPEPVFLMAADFNDDELPDLATVHLQAGGIAMLAGMGDGSFAAPVRTPVTLQVFEGHQADFNLDGTPDIAVCGKQGYTDSKAAVYLGDGLGGFTGSAMLTTGSAPRGLGAGDLTEDGNPDLVVSSLAAYDVFVFPGRGDGTFDSALVHSTFQGLTDLVVADLDGDTHLDVATCSSGSSPRVGILLGDGAGGFSPGMGFAFDYNVYGTPRSILADDFDGDGIKDLAVAISSPTYDEGIAILEGVGDGSFVPMTFILIEPPPMRITTADVNRDGVRDLVAGGGVVTHVYVLFGVGDGSFEPPLRFSGGLGGSGLVVADFDLDCSEDIAISNQESDDITVLVNSGRYGPLLQSYCRPLPHSGGESSAISFHGSQSIAAADARLEVTHAPAFELGWFFCGTDRTKKPFGDGLLCIANPHRRLSPPVQVSASGSASYSLDFAGSGFAPGSTWNFQFWFQDSGAGSSGFNLSSAVTVELCP
jgi:hypothetical protein